MIASKKDRQSYLKAAFACLPTKCQKVVKMQSLFLNLQNKCQMRAQVKMGVKKQSIDQKKVLRTLKTYASFLG